MTNDEINQKIGEGFGVPTEWWKITDKEGCSVKCQGSEKPTLLPQEESVNPIYPDYCSSVDECLKLMDKDEGVSIVTFYLEKTNWFCALESQYKPGLIDAGSDAPAKAFAQALVKYLEARG